MKTIILNPAGALGDFVLSWPIVRAAMASGPTLLVAQAEKAELAAESLGVPARPIHAPPWNRLLLGHAATGNAAADRMVSIGPLMPESRGVIAESCPGMAIIETTAPLDRISALEWAAQVGPVQPTSLVRNPQGSIVLHIGSGGESKRWPLDRWLSLASLLRNQPLQLLAGEVEQERLSKTDRRAFQDAGGRFLGSLAELAQVLKAARMAITADSGPGHLAAGLGIPTLSLFGQTDPARWAPIGPVCLTLAPPTPSPMDWLSVESVLASVRSLDDRLA